MNHQLQLNLDKILGYDLNIFFPNDIGQIYSLFNKAAMNVATRNLSCDDLRADLNSILSRNILMPHIVTDIQALFDTLCSAVSGIDSNKYFKDPINYNNTEEGKYYTMKQKTCSRKKILAECVFRTEKRNSRLPEYVSGLMCTVNNLQNTMGPEWGYRLYFDDNFLEKNILFKGNFPHPLASSDDSLPEATYGYGMVGGSSSSEQKKPVMGSLIQGMSLKGSNYEYGFEFPLEDLEKWKTIFENIEEGLIFQRLLSQLNAMDNVELFNVKLKPDYLKVNNFPVGLFGTNYRFHASLDKTKDLVYMKDVDFGMTKDLANMWKVFEQSNKSITYYFFPWYKPPTHCLVQYPFSVIAYFWGIKPKKVNPHYTLDSIIEYFIKFNDQNPETFFIRNPSTNFKEKGSYGSDEIILTDYIFSGFKVSDTLPFAQKYDFNTILLFFIIMESVYINGNDSNKKQALEKIINDRLRVIKNTVDNSPQLKKILVDDKKWDFNNSKNFIFGTNENVFSCLLPLFNEIPNIKYTALYYKAYNKVLYNMVQNTDNCHMNFKDTFYSLLVKFIKEDPKSNGMTDEEINDVIFEHTLTNHSGWTYKGWYTVYNNPKYIFNKYYMLKNYLPGFEAKYSNAGMWEFIEHVINECRYQGLLDDTLIEQIDIYFNNDKYPKPTFFQPLWGPGREMIKDFDKCIPVNAPLRGGSSSYGNYGIDSSRTYGIYGYNTYSKFDYMKGDGATIVPLNLTSPRYNVYKDNMKAILTSNTIISKNIAETYGKNIKTNKLPKKASVKFDVETLYNSSIYQSKPTDGEVMQFIKTSTFKPYFHAVLWKLMGHIINVSGDLGNDIHMFDSGNSLAYLERGVGEFPWDDDIDVGFKTDSNYNSFKELLRKLYNSGLVITLYAKENNVNYDNFASGKRWSDYIIHKQINSLSDIDMITPTNIWFLKVSITPKTWMNIKEKLGIPEFKLFFGSSPYEAIPWVDIIPHIPNGDGTYSVKYPRELDINTPLKINNYKERVNGIVITIPDNLQEAILKYKPLDKYHKQDKIYNHINSKSKMLYYNETNDKNAPESRMLQKEVHDYIINHSTNVIKIMDVLSNDDFKTNNVQSGGDEYYKQKYLKYKQKYIELKSKISK